MSRAARQSTSGSRAGKPARRRAAPWIALFGILFQALVPNYVMAAAAARNPGLVPICSTTGIKWVSLDEDAPAPVEMPGDKPCHFCVSATTPCALQAAASVRAAYGAGVAAVPPAKDDLDRSLARPGPRSIRAPPAAPSRLD